MYACIYVCVHIYLSTKWINIFRKYTVVAKTMEVVLKCQSWKWWFNGINWGSWGRLLKKKSQMVVKTQYIFL